MMGVVGSKNLEEASRKGGEEDMIWRLGTIYGTPKISPSDTAMCRCPAGGCWSIIVIAALLTVRYKD